MKLKVITFTNQPDHSGLVQLKKSMDAHKLDYHIITGKWKGYGTKIIELYNYLKTIEGYTHFLFTDAHDTFFLSDALPYVEGIVLSGEKNCWPDVSLQEEIKICALYYKHEQSRWIYPNSGGIIGEISVFMSLFEQSTPAFTDDDQRWWTRRFLEESRVSIDYQCRIFQSIAFVSPDEFTIEGNTLKNNITNTLPTVIHGNGRTPMDHIYKLLP